MCEDNANVTKGFLEWFLGALAKLQETISFINVCPFIRMEHLDFHWMDFHEIC